MNETLSSILICPICGARFEYGAKSLRCASGHAFDIAREGYCNLLRPGKMKNKSAGDDKMMVSARRAFLSTGYYSGALDHIIKSLRVYAPDDGVLLDAGCGTGYYANKTAQALLGLHVVGIDASKHASACAAREAEQAGLSERTAYITASLAHMPVKDCSADMLLSMFSPCDYAEFSRVLKPGGTLLIGSAGENHLYEMRELLYGEGNVRRTEPIAHETAAAEYGFSPVERECVEYEIVITGKDKIEELFSMTPFYWRSPAEGAARLRELLLLKTRPAFDFTVLRKV